MALPPNVEPSAFRRGEYKAYDPRGQIWRVRKDGTGGWEAVPAPNNPARYCDARIHGSTLTAVAQTIASRQPARVVEPF